MRIDAHAHVVTDAYRSEIEARGLGVLLPAVSGVEGLEASMEQYGIDSSIISVPPPGVWNGDRDRARELARETNGEMAMVVRRSPARFAALATLPLPDVEGAMEEIAFAFDQLHLDGVGLFSNYDGVYLGDPRFDPVFDELDRRGAYVFVHPTQPTMAVQPELPIWLCDFPFDTTRAAVQLIYSGTLERCPNLRLQLAHLGGTAPFIAHRIAEWAAREPEKLGKAPAGAVDYLSRLWFDTGLSNNSIAVAAVREMAGLDRIVFGTDWPYAVLPSGSDPAPELHLDDADRSLIEGPNVAGLVPRLNY
jgi:predicted TIM-barrel fold metal-dependent hydrolase